MLFRWQQRMQVAQEASLVDSKDKNSSIISSIIINGTKNPIIFNDDCQVTPQKGRIIKWQKLFK